MFSFVHCNRRSLQCLPHRNVRIARECFSFVYRHAPGSRAGMYHPFFWFIFTFSPFQAMPPGLELKTNIDFLTNNKTRNESNTAND